MPGEVVNLYCFEGVGRQEAMQLIQTLSRTGLSVRESDLEEEGDYGILLFPGIDQAVLDWLGRRRSRWSERVLATVTKNSRLTSQEGWRVLHAGAADLMRWDGSHSVASAIAARFEHWRAVDDLMGSPLVQGMLVGQSPVWRSLLRQVVEVARFTDASVLILGESGTGKELIGRLIHTLDARAGKRDLVILDCTTIIKELAGSEFFGHERGAFTHAYAVRDGAFALADGGTLFLDEVGELPLSLQPELLRVIQEHSYKRVGSNSWKQSSFRLVCATNRDLRQEEARGNFRRDLYYRIANWTFMLPSLRERREDVLPLARHFLRQFYAPGEPPRLDPAVDAFLLGHPYPGNVRELRQLVLRMAQRHVGPGPITVGDIPEQERPQPGDWTADWYDSGFESNIRRALSIGVGLKRIAQETAEIAIRVALAEEEGNVQRAAQKLGVTDRALQMRRAAQRHSGRWLEGDGQSPRERT